MSELRLVVEGLPAESEEFAEMEGKFLFQTDVFNLPNRTYLGASNTRLSTASFGIFTNQGNAARKLQFSGRISF